MKILLNLLLLSTPFIGLTQQYIFGDFQSRYLLAKKIYFDSNAHSIAKPYLVSFNEDTITQKGIWKYGSSMEDSKVKIFPLIGGGVKNDLTSYEYGNYFMAGVQLNGKLGDKMFAQFRLGYQLGKLSLYEQEMSYKRPMSPGIGLLQDSLDFSYSTPLYSGILSYQASKYFVLSGGIGKHFFGEGYRSLWLSDYAPSYPFVKMESTFWKVKYINLLSMHNDEHMAVYGNKKYAASHLLSFNITNSLNLSVFETVVWQGKDTLNNRGFDVNYLNPFVFFRPVEYGIGSSDNSFLGAGLKFTWGDHYVGYCKVLFDEFLLSEIRDNQGWWGNKYAFQVGVKTFDVFQIKGLYTISEVNRVRPYTYSHVTSQLNYGHANHSLAHPLEANFIEYLLLIGFQRENFDISLKHLFQKYGKDYQSYNFGGNIFNSYTDRNGDYGHKVGQGDLVEQHLWELRLSWLLGSLTNTKIFTQFNYNFSEFLNSPVQERLLFQFGISSNLWQSYMDY